MTDDIDRSPEPKRVTVVLTEDEAQLVLQALRVQADQFKHNAATDRKQGLDGAADYAENASREHWSVFQVINNTLIAEGIR